LEIKRVYLTTGADGREPNGRAHVVARFSGADGATLAEDLLAGLLQLRVRDGDGSFDVLLPMTHCRSRARNGIVCEEEAGVRARLLIGPAWGSFPSALNIRLRVSRLSNAQTGMPLDENPLEGPATLELIRPLETTVGIANCCRRNNRTAITCR
jgi:hypothetical protein